MQTYKHTREKREKRAGLVGILLTLGVHALVLVVCLSAGLSYLDPPPPERTSLVIEFEDLEEEVKPRQTEIGHQPQAEEIDKEKEVDKLVDTYIDKRDTIIRQIDNMDDDIDLYHILKI